MRHGLPNALVPILTVVGIVAGALLGGTVVIEQVFSIPGVGRLVIGASSRATSRDPGRPLVPRDDLSRRELAVDILYAVVNPRVRLE
jgi:peptide/nickel transport system permease protein